MKKYLNDEQVKKNILTYSITGIIVAFVYVLFTHIPALINFIKGFLRIVAPFLWGYLFAIILLPLDRKIEEMLPKDMKFKSRRSIAAILSVSIFVLLVILVFLIIVPQLITSISSLSKTINNYSSNFNDFNAFLSNTLHLSNETIKVINDYSSQIIQGLLTFANNAIPNIVSVLSTTISTIFNFIMGIVIAIYVLIGRDYSVKLASRFFKAILPEKTYKNGKVFFDFSIQKFAQFFTGKLIDSAIICLICFICMTILRLNYSVLISVVVGVSNIIPFFGPFIGAIPSALILLIDNPTSALIFIIMIIILQQIDGNLIGPRILGESVGLSSIWIMFALIVGGGYFGFAGMLLGVPIFAIIYFIVKFFVSERLEIIEANKNNKNDLNEKEVN